MACSPPPLLLLHRQLRRQLSHPHPRLQHLQVAAQSRLAPLTNIEPPLTNIKYSSLGASSTQFLRHWVVFCSNALWAEHFFPQHRASSSMAEPRYL